MAPVGRGEQPREEQTHTRPFRQTEMHTCKTQFTLSPASACLLVLLFGLFSFNLFSLFCYFFRSRLASFKLGLSQGVLVSLRTNKEAYGDLLPPLLPPPVGDIATVGTEIKRWWK